jgi:hypothetical protein
MDLSVLNPNEDTASEGRSELDSHADTCCGGTNTVVIELTGVNVNVKPFSDEYEAMKDIPVATLGTAYDTADGETYILVLHEALYFGDALQQSLWCPNQLRSNGIVVEDVPQQFDKTSSHSIYLPKQNIRSANGINLRRMRNGNRMLQRSRDRRRILLGHAMLSHATHQHVR